jgi:hypothetical protein
MRVKLCGWSSPPGQGGYWGAPSEAPPLALVAAVWAASLGVVVPVAIRAAVGGVAASKRLGGAAPAIAVRRCPVVNSGVAHRCGVLAPCAACAWIATLDARGVAEL